MGSVWREAPRESEQQSSASGTQQEQQPGLLPEGLPVSCKAWPSLVAQQQIPHLAAVAWPQPGLSPLLVTAGPAGTWHSQAPSSSADPELLAGLEEDGEFIPAPRALCWPPQAPGASSGT